MSLHPFRYSMVVDSSPLHPYQAHLLLFTLEHFGDVPRHRIVVQCTTRVPAAVRHLFIENGYTVTDISPYLDEKCCNKIMQLDYFMRTDLSHTSGIFLLGLDLAILSPVDVSDRSVVWGKIVNKPLPRLSTLERIFSAAGIPFPEIVPCDWGAGNTVATNFNGGFLYVPLAFVGRLRTSWRRWAEFLFARPELFDEPARRKHIDRISFAMATVSERLPHGHLTANWNFPCHAKQRPRTYEPGSPIHVLHYHDGLDPYGLVAPRFSDPALHAAAERVNAALGERRDPLFFDLYKRYRAKQAIDDVPFTQAALFSKDFLARTRMNGTPRRLVLHAGTLKTGTSSLQQHLALQRDRLAADGVWYPPSSHWKKSKPSHPQIFRTLLRTDEAAFVEYVQELLCNVPESIHTIILSAEGIYNHWQDQHPRAKGLLRHLASLFDFEICVWFREPVSFAALLYAQYLSNIKMTGPQTNVYGQNISFDEAIQDDWFRKHLDFLGFYYELQHLFGPDRVTPFLYSGDTVGTFLRHYAVKRGQAIQVAEVVRRQNVGLSVTGIQFMRFLNRWRGLLSVPHQRRVKSLVRGIDHVLHGMVPAFRLTEQQAALVNRYAGRGWAILQEECRKSADSRQVAR